MFFEPIFEKYYQLKYYPTRNLQLCKLKTSSIPSKTSKIDAFLVTQNVVYELKYFSITYRHENFFATYIFTQDHLEKISGKNHIPKCPYWHHLGVNDTNERTVSTFNEITVFKSKFETKINYNVQNTYEDNHKGRREVMF